MIEIDGSIDKGGGQTLRTACALSAVTKKPCRIFNIRKGGPNPGLAVQHLLGIQILNQLSNGKLKGDYLGSEEVTFYPGEIKARNLNVKIETAGSITMVLQTVLLPILCSPEPLKLTFDGGATDTFFSPTTDYFQYVFLKILEKINTKAEVNIQKRGYYPDGGAKLEIKIYPSQLKNIDLTERGQFKNITIISGASESFKNKRVAERQLAGIREVLGKLNLPTEEKTEYYQTQSSGSQICLIAEFENTVIGAYNLGKLGKRAEDIGKEAALELLEEQKSGACLDKYSTDQILPYLAIVQKKSRITSSEITNRCKTNIWVIEKFIEGRFEIKDRLISWIP